MRMKTKIENCAGHLLFLAALPSNYVVVKNLNKHPFLKGERLVII